MTPEQQTFRQACERARIASEQYRDARDADSSAQLYQEYYQALADLSQAIEVSRQALIRQRVRQPGLRDGSTNNNS
jgi:hypothetical protein